MKKIVFTEKGNLLVTCPSSDSDIDAIFSALPPELSPMIIDDADLPKDRTDREAWILDNGKVSLNPAKVKPKGA